jgi:hypothetical protein
VDTLRVVLSSGVIVVHTATAYVRDFAGCYYDDERVTNSVVSIAFALPALMGGVFGLGPLFVVAGWFSVRSLARRGPAGFMGSRLLRLGIPLVFFVLHVNPLAEYLGNLCAEDATTFLGNLADTEFSIMWFVVALLACTLGYAALRSIRPLTGSRPRQCRRSLVVAASVIGVGSLAVWQFTTLLDTHLLNVRVSAWTQTTALFALGVIEAESGWDGRLSRQRRAPARTDDRGRLRPGPHRQAPPSLFRCQAASRGLRSGRGDRGPTASVSQPSGTSLRVHPASGCPPVHRDREGHEATLYATSFRAKVPEIEGYGEHSPGGVRPSQRPSSGDRGHRPDRRSGFQRVRGSSP